MIWYADRRWHVGHGNLRDSQTADPGYVYEYLAGSGDFKTANIRRLVGQPYDMSNWALQQNMPLNNGLEVAGF